MKINNDQKIKVVETFIKYKNIPQTEIANKLKISSASVNRIITKYLADKCLILESKINPIKTNDSRKVKIDGIVYNSAKEAGQILGLTVDCIYKRKVFLYQKK
jgi:transcription initiation factor IIE alpha subunit